MMTYIYIRRISGERLCPLGGELQRLATAAGRVRSAGHPAVRWRGGQQHRRRPGGTGCPLGGRRGGQLSRHGPAAGAAHTPALHHCSQGRVFLHGSIYQFYRGLYVGLTTSWPLLPPNFSFFHDTPIFIPHLFVFILAHLMIFYPFSFISLFMFRLIPFSYPVFLFSCLFFVSPLPQPRATGCTGG
jgi:hypothetical protein